MLQVPIQTECIVKDKWAGQYVFSVLSAICCFGPLSTIGLLHILSAQTEHRSGNILVAKAKQRQAKLWTTASWIFGLLVLAALAFNYFGAALFTPQIHKTETDYRANRVNHRTLQAKPSRLYAPELQYEMTREQDRLAKPAFIPELEFEIRREYGRTKKPAFISELAFEIQKEGRKTTTEPYVAELHYEIQKEKSKSQ